MVTVILLLAHCPIYGGNGSREKFQLPNSKNYRLKEKITVTENLEEGKRKLLENNGYWLINTITPITRTSSI